MTPLLQLCDVIRDDTLPELGVRLEDHEGDGEKSFRILCETVQSFKVKKRKMTL